MLTRFWLILIFIATLVPLRAQDDPIHMRPEFPLIFPLEQNGNDVTVKYPILINPTTVLKPGMQLRVIYILSNNGSGDIDLGLAHKGNLEQSYARDPSASSGSDGPKMDPNVAHEIEGYRRTVWQVSNNFVLAMAQYPTDTMHLIYSPTNKNQDLRDSRFSFFDGLMVGLPNGKVTVIAVEKESYAEQAGLKAGDEIESVGAIPVKGDLTSYSAAYSAAKKAAKENEVAAYTMMIRAGGAGDPKQIKVPLPPKIGSGLMNGF